MFIYAFYDRYSVWNGYDHRTYRGCDSNLPNSNHKHQTLSEEVAASQRVMCGSIVLNGDPAGLQHRVANAVYESCREGHAVLPNFPNFEPVIKALRENAGSTQDQAYKVCVAKCDRLVILQSLARRWIDYEGSKEEANALIAEHNKNFNVDGDYLEDDERTEMTQSVFECFWGFTRWTLEILDFLPPFW